MKKDLEKSEKQNKETNDKLRAEMNERFEKVEKQNKNTNEKLHILLEHMKRIKVKVITICS
ncbi:hypothetical protein [Mycoplasmopsis agassizii]|uniref:Uncharacterized protein n=1 Tax=Mycoplasmopsis agassizii TaxID=33922 RepID=A0ABX4H5M5_9BACT|nr:hypothetical protein [Mycoplasmopsis agassizii]PAF55189.1 hypothetical protein CJF60_00685 [Mycoplasmopsis agassizii]SMC19855.1 hypothetical protein SAMN02745179_00958 [Mycoplasmopsis agassizii]